MWRHGGLAFALLLGGLAGAAPAQEKIRWKFTEGETFYVEEKVHTRQTVKIQDSVQPQELDQTKVSRFKVLKALPEGGAVLEQKILSLQATPQGAGAKADASVLRHFRGAVFRITLDAKQRVSKLEGYKALTEAIARENPDAAKLLRVLLTKDNLQRPVEALLGFAPEKEVARGDSWKLTSKVPFANFGTLEVTDTYTLRGEEQADKGVVRVAVATSVTYAAPAEAGGLPFKVVGGDVKVTESKGGFLFNAAAGKLVRRETELTLRGLFTVALGNQRLDMEIEQRQSAVARVLSSNPLKK
jgi:hypothetical protein